MTDPPTAQAAAARKRPSRWPERLLLVAGLLLVAAGLLLFPFRHLLLDATRAGITGEVLPELEDTERIEAEPGDLRGFNLLVITTDTTRADHIGAYGNRSVETPVIDGLARAGILLADAITPSPSTLPAHSSLMTGLSPLHHGARANGTFRLEERVSTLAERLGAAGYRTGAVISAFVLDSRFGLDQGFERYDDDLTKGVKLSPHMFRERPAELTNEPAVRWLREGDERPFFLWVHYFDPHAAYLPPEPFRKRYADDLYDGEIAYVDSQIGALLAELEELGLRERTLVVYTSDHGEGLGEHGEQTHSLLTYDATLHVPLILSAPAALPRGKVIRRQTSLVDVMPTALALLGEPVPDGLDGRDLTRPPAPGPRPIYFETIATMTLHGWAPLLGVRRDDYKYILAPEPELYDLVADPRELDNVHAAESEVVQQLEGQLVEAVGGDPLLAARVPANLELDEETRQQLAGLGYVQTVSDGAAAPLEQRDPKHMIHQWEKLQLGINLKAQGQMAEALPILEECVAEVEGDVFARNVLAGAYMLRGEREKALATYRETRELEPNDVSAPLGIAGVYMLQGKLDEAEVEIDRAFEIQPESGTVFIQRGRLALMRRREAEALELFERAIEMDPGSTGPIGHVQIGHLHLRANRLDQAREAFQSAIRIDALNGPARDGLANVLIREEKLDEAARTLAAALRFDPSQPRALATLAALISRQGDDERALATAQKALELNPNVPEAHNAIGLIRRRQGRLDLAEEHYKKAIEHGPWLDQPHVNLAQLYMRQGRSEEAVEEFKAALRANRFSRIALANLGVHYFNEGDVDRALSFYRIALRVDPNYALVHRNIASIYALREQPGRAAYHLRRSLELDPEQPDVEQIRYALSQADAAADAGTAPTPAPAETPPPTRAYP
jgi:arylsulfatase A-like enzyme/Tfp pilus assembly protein PilF